MLFLNCTIIIKSGDCRDWDMLEAKAKKVENMSKEDVCQLKCNAIEQHDKDKTMKQIFNDGHQQLLEYVHNLKEKDHQNRHEFSTSAFVVLTVGSRKLLWEKIYTD